MNVKKMWLYAVLFGLIMSLLMLLIIRPDEEIADNVAEDTNETEQKDDNTSVGLENEHANQGLTNSEHKPFFKVEKGKRAVSISVNEVQGVSGFVQPGDYVDAVVVVPPPEGENSSSQILLQNIKVLAAGKNIMTENKKDAIKETEKTIEDAELNQINEEVEEESSEPLTYQTITLEVLPQEGAALIFAAEKGFVSLMLRQRDDKGNSPHVHITLDQINKGMIPK